MNRRKRLLSGIVCLCIAASAAGCGNTKEYNDGKKYYSAPKGTKEVSGAAITNSYDAQMTAVVKYNNTEIGIVIVVNADTGEEYTMTYNDTLQIVDRYGNEKTISYLKGGDVIDAYYLKNAVQLTGVIYNDDVWEYTEVNNWQVDTESDSVTVGDEKYYYNKDKIYIISDGNFAEFQDLNSQDIVSVRGIGKKVISISIDKGHGYIKLAGIDKFIGGWVQVGKVIKPISQDMLLVAPEGNYDVKIVKDGYGGALNATIPRNEEVTLDFSDVSAKIVQYGTVEFTILPKDANATLKIAGQVTNYSSPVLLEYDTYNVTVEADGYETYSGKLKVGQNLSQISMNLTAKDSTSTPGATSTSSPASATDATATPQPTPTSSSTVIVTATETPQDSGAYTITVTDPEGAKVYFDDEYKGEAPVSFPKVSGTHTLTLSQDGYQTKSYTLDISESQDNVKYCMPALVQN